MHTKIFNSYQQLSTKNVNKERNFERKINKWLKWLCVEGKWPEKLKNTKFFSSSEIWRIGKIVTPFTETEKLKGNSLGWGGISGGEVKVTSWLSDLLNLWWVKHSQGLIGSLCVSELRRGFWNRNRGPLAIAEEMIINITLFKISEVWVSRINDLFKHKGRKGK